MKKTLLITLAGVFILALIIIGFFLLQKPNKDTADTASSQQNSTTVPSPIKSEKQSGYALNDTPPIFLTVVTHSEEIGIAPNYVNNRKAYEASHAELIDFANMIKRNNIGWDYQSDYNFLLAVQKYDQGTEETNNKNIVRWIQEDISTAEVDPHAHGRTYSYADVAYILKELGVSDTGIVGGFIAYPPAKSELDKVRNPINGLNYDYTWQSKATWGSGPSNHVHDDKIQASGVWRPKSEKEFRIDDSSQLPNIGSLGNEWSDLRALLEDQKNGKLEKGNIYTISITAHQGQMSNETTTSFEAEFKEFAQEIENGRIVLVTLPEVLEIWEKDYASIPNIYTRN